jgi:hypothetical protein
MHATKYVLKTDLYNIADCQKACDSAPVNADNQAACGAVQFDPTQLKCKLVYPGGPGKTGHADNKIVAKSGNTQE